MAGVSEFIGNIIPVAVVPAVAISLATWKGDGALSKEGAEVLYKSIAQTAANPSVSPIESEILRLLRKYFSRDHGIWRFIRNVGVFTLCSMVAVLGLYVAEHPSLAGQLSSEGFLSQFFGDGFTKVFLVNALTFSVYSFFLDRMAAGSAAQSLLTIIVDLALKVVIFIGLTVLTYVIFTNARGAFGGSRMAAIQSIPTTMMFAVKFEALTAVYLYSLAISSFPIFVVAVIRVMANHAHLSKFIRGVLFFLPFKDRPIRAVSVVFSVFVGLLSMIVWIIVSPLA